MGAIDAQRQALNVYKMELLGATIHPVQNGLKTLKEATTAAIQAWVGDIKNIFMLLEVR